MAGGAEVLLDPQLSWMKTQLETSSQGVLLAAALASVVFALAFRPRGSKSPSAGERLPCPSPTASPTSAASSLLDGGDPCLQGTIFPSTGLLRSNPVEPYPFENENCSGMFVPLHRPTYDPALDKSGEYPFGDHFKGRRRLWELRLQVKFKARVESPLLIGIELEEYVPLNAAAQRTMGLTVAALRKVAGNDLYHSIGDDPTKKEGPHEKPIFVMPLWACDQIIVTPEGEEPPSLADPQFSNYGDLRTADRKAFIETVTNMQLVPGPTYTFCFWGISQFLDVIKWEVQKVIPFKSIDFNQFCGKPPVQIVFYTLGDPVAQGDNRHLQCRKNYYFRFALWSSEKKPRGKKLQELLQQELTFSSSARHDGQAGHQKATNFSRMFGCCTGCRASAT